jgi:hypothetical protein
MVARTLTHEPKITWQVPESADCDVKVYDTVYKLTHGDQFRGGGGIAGIYPPLSRGQYRKALRQAALGRPFNWLVMGHWHQYHPPGRGLIINGSLKGYDEYAYTSNFDFEIPTQAFWITTPQHGPSFVMPIFPMDRAKEGW